MPAGAGGIADHVDYPPSNHMYGRVGVRVPTGVQFLNRGHRRLGAIIPTVIRNGNLVSLRGCVHCWIL
jgi:hypothetical protein